MLKLKRRALERFFNDEVYMLDDTTASVVINDERRFMHVYTCSEAYDIFYQHVVDNPAPYYFKRGTRFENFEPDDFAALIDVVVSHKPSLLRYFDIDINVLDEIFNSSDIEVLSDILCTQVEKVVYADVTVYIASANDLDDAR